MYTWHNKGGGRGYNHPLEWYHKIVEPFLHRFDNHQIYFAVTLLPYPTYKVTAIYGKTYTYVPVYFISFDL